MAKLELFYPVKNPCFRTQGFGEHLVDYSSYGMIGHNGWDIVGTLGQLCRAAHDGEVVFAGEDNSAGLGIVIRTLNKREFGAGEAYFKTIYWHLKPGSVRVTAGQKVRVGDLLAECDTTGKVTGTHLHFGLKPVTQGEADWQWFNLEQKNGYLGAIDPAPFWTGLYAEDVRSWYDQLAIIRSKLAELVKVVFGIIKT